MDDISSVSGSMLPPVNDDRLRKAGADGAGVTHYSYQKRRATVTNENRNRQRESSSKSNNEEASSFHMGIDTSLISLTQ